jgi:hypothetical protein
MAICKQEVMVAITQQQMSQKLPTGQITLCKEEEVAITQLWMRIPPIPGWRMVFFKEEGRRGHNPAKDESESPIPPPAAQGLSKEEDEVAKTQQGMSQNYRTSK